MPTGSGRKITSIGNLKVFRSACISLLTGTVILTIFYWPEGTWQGWQMWRQQTQAIPTWTMVWWWTAEVVAPGSLFTAGPGIMATLMSCWISSKWEISIASQWSWKLNLVRMIIRGVECPRLCRRTYKNLKICTFCYLQESLSWLKHLRKQVTIFIHYWALQHNISQKTNTRKHLCTSSAQLEWGSSLKSKFGANMPEFPLQFCLQLQ